MPDVGQRDRTPFPLEWTRTPWPAPPLNLFFASGYSQGVIDLRWDNPAILAVNAPFHVVGVNLYRSFDSEFGPFQRITELPSGATYWRDQTDNELVVEEDVTDRFTSKGPARAGQDEARYSFRTLHSPIVQEGSQKVPATSPWDVRVFVDGVEARVLRVHGPTGEVEIDDFHRPDVGTQSLLPTIVPGPLSRVTCTYRYTRSFLRADQFQRVFYRVTTVALRPGCDPSCACPEDLLETPLEHAASTSIAEIEKLDYIWREAIRRNRWILDQGGERVKVFLRKHTGIPCPCVATDHHRQPLNDCLRCFGTGFLGGYEGPYDVLIAPDDAERRISQRADGRVKEHAYEVWTGPSPLLSMRDFLVKQNNERYALGAVRMPSNRGNVLQQHFSIGVLATNDIRTKVPVGDPVQFVATQLRPRGPEVNADASITESSEQHGIPAERELKGRTLVWENINY